MPKEKATTTRKTKTKAVTEGKKKKGILNSCSFEMVHLLNHI